LASIRRKKKHRKIRQVKETNTKLPFRFFFFEIFSLETIFSLIIFYFSLDSFGLTGDRQEMDDVLLTRRKRLFLWTLVCFCFFFFKYFG